MPFLAARRPLLACRANAPDSERIPTPVAPLPPHVVPYTQVFSPKDYTMKDYPVPRAMTQQDIATVIAAFA